MLDSEKMMGDSSHVIVLDRFISYLLFFLKNSISELACWLFWTLFGRSRLWIGFS